ncbi:MAG: energy-coupling factor transporter ATPase [Clostridia bacterium]|nr:energy-coupling factor transporter ATPase [Clostridia bacterium]MDY4083161.1 energy-coupling factor transporter ATPase [Eubacteriales bacterium]
MSIVVKNLSFTYGTGTAYQKKALDDINLVINEGDFVGIVGHTGSGKSTFIQHINGLIKPQEGEVQVFDILLTNAKKPKPDLRRLRGSVGMVFQYPEYQLFEESVYKDVAFGPKNLGLTDEEIKVRVKEAIELVGLDYDKVKDRAPFELSGGQKRRVAIAGIIAMRPKVLILDEPSAGLDPYGKEQILSLITRLKKDVCPTIVVISHDIDEITRFASRIVVFNESKIAYDIPMAELFEKEEELTAMGLDIPTAVKIKKDLAKKGIDLQGTIVNENDLEKAIVNAYNSKRVDKNTIDDNLIGGGEEA